MPTAPSRLAWVLAALAAIGPFAIDTYLPAFPAMAQGLQADALQVQQSLSVYMAAFAFMSLRHGALSDSLGRRRVILVAMAVFAVSSLLCALASSITLLWAGRALQGLSAGAGMVVGRAVIRDLYDGADAQRLLSRVMLIFAIAPAIAPLIGGGVLELAGWRAVFVFLGGFGLVLWVITLRFLPETLPPEQRQPLALNTLWQGYREVFGTPRFMRESLAIGCLFNGFFVYVLAAPVFVMQHLGLTTTGFGWLFVPAVLGMMAGSWLSARIAGLWSRSTTLRRGLLLSGLASSGAIVHAGLFAPSLPASVLPIGLYTLGMALAMPSMTLIALERIPQRRGMAASAQSTVQVGTNALTAGLIVPLLWHTPLTLALGSAAFLLAALLLWHTSAASGSPPT